MCYTDNKRTDKMIAIKEIRANKHKNQCKNIEE